MREAMYVVRLVLMTVILPPILINIFHGLSAVVPSGLPEEVPGLRKEWAGLVRQSSSGLKVV